MQPANMYKAGIFALVIVMLFISGWEYYWRSEKMPISFNDDASLWVNSRRQVYQPADKATVFIGSSRIKFDLDIPEWEKFTGEKAVQLAIVGTNPVPVLQDLANDKNFKGKLVIDVTEPLFFSQNPGNYESANDGIDLYKKQTPSQRFSSNINYFLEDKFVFLEENKFAVNALLADLQLPDRKGVFSEPVFPKTFEVTNYNRQTYMTDAFLKDPAQIKRQTDIWTFFAKAFKAKPMSGDTLRNYLEEIKTSIDKIKSRGGKVVFVRTPASGPMEAGTKQGYPRNAYWERILEETGSPGIHYEDDPTTANFICPEWSHLSPSDAILYTRSLIATLKGMGWFTPNTN